MSTVFTFLGFYISCYWALGIYTFVGGPTLILPISIAVDQALAKRKDELWDVKIRASTRAVNIPEVVWGDPQVEHFSEKRIALTISCL